MWDANALLFSITGYSRTPALHWDPKIPGGTSSQGLQEHFPTLKGLNFAQVSESLAWRTSLVCTEVPLSPEQVWTGASGTSIELMVVWVTKDRGCPG